MSLTLTSVELAELTGYSQAKRQEEWLIARGWPFEPPARRGGPPAVDRSYYLDRMAGRVAVARKSRLRLDKM